MNKRIIMLMAAALALLSASGQVEFTGVGEYQPIKVVPENNTDLKMIYVLYNTDGVGMTFTSLTGERATWQTYDAPGGHLYFEDVPVSWDGYKTTLNQVIPNKGYIIKEGEGSKPYYCWVVNYADYYLELNDLFYNNETPCNLISFRIDGHGDAIPYCAVDGRRFVLDREIKLKYNTLVWDDSTHWQEQEIIENLVALDQAVEIAPPLCNTAIEMSGDRFLEEWGIGTSAEADYFYTQAVDCGTTAVQDEQTNKNVKKGLGSGLGGSAPVHIVFTGYPTDAVAFRMWEMATDPEFENIILQYNQDEVDYVFDEWGIYYMRYRVANADGSCETYGTTYTINISESALDCPNFFSPGTTPGDNDIWMVSYKSIIEFHCWIFNRWGTLIYEFTDPGGGWDGKYRGRFVDPGVYYYVITAKGSDGVSHNKRGDITILRYNKRGGGTSSGEGAGDY